MLSCWLCGCLHCEGCQRISLKDQAVLEDARNDGTTNLQNVGHCLSSERASHLKRHEDSSYVELFHCFLWPSGFIKGKELLDLTSCAEGLCCVADQFILFLQMAILNYKNFINIFSSKFPMMKVNVILSLLCHAGLQGEWRRSSIEAMAAPTVQSIPTFVWTSPYLSFWTSAYTKASFSWLIVGDVTIT